MPVNERGSSPRRDTSLNIRADSDDEYTHLDQDPDEHESWQSMMEANYDKNDLHGQCHAPECDFLASEDGSDDEERDGSSGSNCTDDDNYSQDPDGLPLSTWKQFQSHFHDATNAGELDIGLTNVRKPESLEPFLAYFDGEMNKREITTILLQVSHYLRDNRPDEAEFHAQKALGLAENSGERALVARCKYWKGRVKYAQGDYTEAHQWFGECQLWIAEYPEGSTMAHYMHLSRPELDDEERQRICQETRRHGRRLRTVSTISEAPAIQTSKRPWEDSLHLLSVENVPQTVPRRKRANPKSQLDKLPKDTGGFELTGRQKVFSFEMYPVGMASRYRPTKIFAEQPHELIVPQKKWDDFIEHHKDKSVTMSYLEREQRRYRTKLQERIYQRR
ncbi:tetratricopeptide repeat protein [Aspergillus ibericus CBS 121593]|uniref:TPR-like protein n=1 Tax=Aspergillus ibericus CBS 121593 TaxID=1448316 RepID=A0A395HEP4_9EURO|nr:hypothetical protein BO80DRAFT_206835 [Aspergillus ibericus CBS 121593]RAL04704.1 hypothetical protein BO80DRAFT_206835 [Aspergillus ibericus CBS 121593]